jgi:hypothetical protein
MSAALPTRTSPRSQSPRFSALNRGKGANTLLAANTAHNATISSNSVPSTPPIGPAERANASSTPQSKPATGTFRAYNMLRSPHLQQQQVPSKAHVPWTNVQLFYRFGLLGLFNGVAFMIFSVFSRPAFARGLVFVARYCFHVFVCSLSMR